jgi:hypothetical protein
LNFDRPRPRRHDDGDGGVLALPSLALVPGFAPVILQLAEQF